MRRSTGLGAEPLQNTLAIRPRVARYASRRPAVSPLQPVSDGVAQPFLKWVGGKGGLLSQLEPLLPEGWRKRPYFEPFMGGGAMFFHLGPKRAVLGDTNRELVACYQVVRDDVESLLGQLERMAALHDKDHFYRTRERWNAGEITSRVERAATFIYFNKTCFNGLWRVNRAGAYNVPMGSYANPGIFMPERLRAASAALRHAHVRLGAYTFTVEDAREGDFVYFDPPYQPVSATANFTAYNADPFGEAEQRKLAAVFALLDERGCRLMLSNSDTPLIKQLYGRFRIDHVYAARNVNSRSDRRGKIPEVVVRNY
jgi:DNA adenine methylase